jgi:hypothetical protein
VAQSTARVSITHARVALCAISPQAPSHQLDLDPQRCNGDPTPARNNLAPAAIAASLFQTLAWQVLVGIAIVGNPSAVSRVGVAQLRRRRSRAWLLPCAPAWVMPGRSKPANQQLESHSSQFPSLLTEGHKPSMQALGGKAFAANIRAP